ncbi:sterol o-acyltransferase (APE2) [Blumeria hordei DH14]|uniref:O-acyltransferase n=1 Tax=Blumeria graminis f. sp. hordei (strain DH14) TaxID=546991 RepID=N1JKA3_BLUG1|nr:sterol o-acyltransferase (APE2) [Blumeria hordei DH14]
MSTSAEVATKSNDSFTHEYTLRSRPVKLDDSSGRSLSHELEDLAKNGSGRSTSVPPNAPPSLQSLSTARHQVREKRRRLFPTIEYASRVSHFDSKSEYRDFKGFYVLFWIALTIMTITTVMRNIKDTGFPTRVKIWQLFRIKVWELAVADGFMILTTTVSLPFHRLFRSKQGQRWGLQWNVGGMIVQSMYQALWFVFWVAIPFARSWTWTAQVFLILHTFVLLMKMHSYAFYNGHLSETERRLQSLDQPATASKAPAYQYPGVGEVPLPKSSSTSDRDLIQLREDLAMELTSPTGSSTYPKNLTWSNYWDYLLCPTLCYELEYPRTDRIVWSALGYKVLAVFGVIFLLTNTSEEFIVPVLAESAERLETAVSLSETILILAETVSLLLFPFMVTFLLVFLVIFEYVLGAFAEITCFADRHFYSDWWNSTDWLEFSREWNIPVHNFFRRHVYSASTPHFGRPMATLITFLISSLGHELVMACITKKVRGYGFLAQMSQLPLVVLQRTKWVREKKLLNNICFWCSTILGLSTICSLYVLC